MTLEAGSRLQPEDPLPWRAAAAAQASLDGLAATLDPRPLVLPPAPASVPEQLWQELERLRRENAELREFREMAYRDPLTGLRNRRYFNERLTEEFDRVRRAPQHFSVMVGDLNGLKRINDYSGHGAGDEAIRRFGQLLAANLRKCDVCCRTGGDEFMTILPNADADACRVVLARLRQAVAAAAGDDPDSFGVSMGTASWPVEGATPEELIANADAAMYADKRRQKAERLAGFILGLANRQASAPGGGLDPNVHKLDSIAPAADFRTEG